MYPCCISRPPLTPSHLLARPMAAAVDADRSEATRQLHVLRPPLTREPNTLSQLATAATVAAIAPTPLPLPAPPGHMGMHCCSKYNTPQASSRMSGGSSRRRPPFGSGAAGGAGAPASRVSWRRLATREAGMPLAAIGQQPGALAYSSAWVQRLAIGWLHIATAACMLNRHYTRASPTPFARRMPPPPFSPPPCPSATSCVRRWRATWRPWRRRRRRESHGSRWGELGWGRRRDRVVPVCHARGRACVYGLDNLAAGWVGYLRGCACTSVITVRLHCLIFRAGKAYRYLEISGKDLVGLSNSVRWGSVLRHALDCSVLPLHPSCNCTWLACGVEPGAVPPGATITLTQPLRITTSAPRHLYSQRTPPLPFPLSLQHHVSQLSADLRSGSRRCTALQGRAHRLAADGEAALAACQVAAGKAAAVLEGVMAGCGRRWSRVEAVQVGEGELPCSTCKRLPLCHDTVVCDTVEPAGKTQAAGGWCN